MSKTVLITGGAGFIGSHLADELLAAGWGVRALDALCEQVHGPGARRPAYLNAEVDLRVGDVRDARAVRDALVGVDAVVHLAAAVGVGQSMYEVAHYTGTNVLGTAVLLEALLDQPVERFVVASSMSIYGEGRYVDDEGRVYDDLERRREHLEQGWWEPVMSDGRALTPAPTPEEKTPRLSSIYALTKYDQEQMCLISGRAYGRPTIALRFFNAYGPRQALSNPYTGVLAIFAARLLNGRSPLLFEDGGQRRDFVSVHDVARACRLAVERPGVADVALNVGSGRSRSVKQVAELLERVLGIHVPIVVTEKYRSGDIRHCFGDTERARSVLGYVPRVALEDGIQELADWLLHQQADDGFDRMRTELERRGLTL
jgi:dTDP-L-rhamnose 4-epimerase